MRSKLSIVLWLAVGIGSASGQDSDDAFEHVGYVWRVSMRSSGDEAESTYFIFCREEIRRPVDTECGVVWTPGGVEVAPGQYALVSGSSATVEKKTLDELLERFRAGALDDDGRATLGEYFDLLNAHGSMRAIAYGEPPDLMDRFTTLAYIRAESVTPAERPER